MKKVTILLLAIIASTFAKAQSSDEDSTKKSKIKISIGTTEGINISKGGKNVITNKKKKNNDKISSTLGLDIGFNNFQALPTSASFPYQVQANNTQPIQGAVGKPSSLGLNAAKSMNVNLYPLMYSIHLYKKSVNLITGLGFNWYNFRYTNDVIVTQNIDTNNLGDVGVLYNHNQSNLKKNKMAASYVTLPLSLQIKPKIGKNKLVFGAGLSVGYLVKGWNKSKDQSGGKGKMTNSGIFNTWQTNAIAEVGIDNKIRLYGSYALSDLYKAPLSQKQLAFGIRFFGL
jgi:hypothetical protein